MMGLSVREFEKYLQKEMDDFFMKGYAEHYRVTVEEAREVKRKLEKEAAEKDGGERKADDRTDEEIIAQYV